MLRLSQDQTLAATCPVHPPGQHNEFVQNILRNFDEHTRIQYVNTPASYRVISDSSVAFLVPLVVHIHQHNVNAANFHFAARAAPLKLNCPRVISINLFIINVVKCHCNGKIYNNLLDACKVIRFRYIMIINCDKNRLQHYIKQTTRGYFAFALGKFMHNQFSIKK